MSAPALLDALRRRGIALSARAGQLVVRPATALTPDDRAAIRRHLPELVAALAGGEEPTTRGEAPAASDTWDQLAALRMMFDADALVERFGVDGRHPAIASAAARVTDAHMAHDMPGLRRAVTAFETVVRRVRSNSGRV